MANKIHGGTIQAELTANVSDYMSGLGQATQAAMQFQRTTSGISFQGFNRGIIATTTLLYGMNRIMSQMSQGMEEFSNVLARIGAVSDLTAESVRNLADSMKGISVAYGVGRTDIMKAMYTTAQSRFTKPSEMRFFGSQAAALSRASGKEIDAPGAAKLMTGLVRSLGLDVKKDVASGMLSDMLLKSRDIGRWELREMAPAIAKVATVFGNEFAGRLGGVETLRQMNAIMAVASGTDLPLGMVSTGVRRLVERSYQLRTGTRGEYLRSQLAGLGYDPRDPIQGALQKGPLFYLRDLANISGGSPMELYRLGFQSRELAAVSAALQGKGSQLMSAYQQMSPSGIAGTTGQYTDRMKGTYEFQRDQLRSQWVITSQEFMQASVPAIRSLTDVLTVLNKVARALPTSVKQMMGFVAMLSSLRFALNLLGFKGSIFGVSSARMTGGGDKWALGGTTGMAGGGGVASGVAPSVAANLHNIVRPDAATVAAARLARAQARAAGRSAMYTSGFGTASGAWISPHQLPGMPPRHHGSFPLLSAAQVRQMQGTNLPMPPQGVNMTDLGRLYGTYKPTIRVGVSRLGITGTGHSIDAVIERARAAGDMATVNQLLQYGTKPPGPRVPMGPAWYGSPRHEPMNAIQYYVQAQQQAKLDAARAASNAYWFSPVTGQMRGVHRGYPHQPGWSDRLRHQQLARYGALARHFLPVAPGQLGISGAQIAPGARASKYGPTLEARIRWAAYKQGQSVNFETGQYGTLSPGAQAYSTRGVPQGTMSARDMSRGVAQIDAQNRMFWGGLGGPSAMVARSQFNMPAMGGTSITGVMSGMSQRFAASMGTAISALKSFGYAAWTLAKPMAAFATAMWAASNFISGFSTPGVLRKSALNKYGNDGIDMGEEGASGFGLLAQSAGEGWQRFGARTRDAATTVGDRVGELFDGWDSIKTPWQALTKIGGLFRNEAYDHRDPIGERLASLAPSLGSVETAVLEQMAKKRGLRFKGTGEEGFFGKRGYFSSLWNYGSGDLAGYDRTQASDIMSDVMTKDITYKQRRALGKKGIGTSNFETIRPDFEDYLKDKDFNVPKDWSTFFTSDSRVQAFAGQLRQYFTEYADEIDNGSRRIASSLQRAKDSISHFDIGELSNKHRIHGMMTNMGLLEAQRRFEDMAPKPFTNAKSGDWFDKLYFGFNAEGKNIRTGADHLNKMARVGKDRMLLDIPSALRGNEDAFTQPYDSVLKRTSKLSAEDKLKRVLMFNRGDEYKPMASMMDFVRGQLADPISGVLPKGVDENRIKGIAETILGMDPRQYTNTFAAPKVPFSEALQFGTQAGYNATLEREDDYVVKFANEKITEIISTLTDTRDRAKEETKSWEDKLTDLINAKTKELVDAITGGGGDGPNWNP